MKSKICWIDLGVFGIFLEGAVISSECWQDHGVGLLRTIMHQEGVFTEILSVKNYPNLAAMLPDLAQYTTLLMNVRSYHLGQAQDIAKQFKRMQPDGWVIVGGMHTMVNLAEMEAIAEFDHICVGAGEKTISALARFPLAFPRVVQGVAADSMDDWPEIDRRLWPAPKRLDLPYPLEPTMKDWNKGPIASIITSKVCPWRCSFCNEASYIPNMVRKSVDKVIDELNHLDEAHGPIGSVVIHDSMFFQQPAWLEAWCEQYPKRTRKPWPYWAAARADTIRRWPNLFMRLVTQTNWSIVSIGLESGSDNTLKTLNKECTVEDNLYAIGLINLIGDRQRAEGKQPVKLFSNLMFGVPGETREDVLKTMNLQRLIKRPLISYSLYAPYPGSALGYQLIAEDKSLLNLENLDRTPTTAKTKGIDYQFIAQSWAGQHRQAAFDLQNAWLAEATQGKMDRLTKFRPAHRFFVFKMKNGQSKIAWGVDAASAAAILRLRLTPEEWDMLILDEFETFYQQQLPDFVSKLG